LVNRKTLILFQIIIAATFIFSAISKILSPGYFEITLLDQGLFSDRGIASYFARIFIILELALGLFFLQSNYLKKIFAPATIILLIIFIGHMLFLILLGDNDNCGCFSSVIKMNPLEAIIKNLVLIVITFFVFKYSDPKPNSKTIPFSMFLFSVLFVFITTPISSTEEFPFLKYTNFENEGRVDLAEGEKIIAIFDATCDHCFETAKSLKRLDSELEDFPQIYILIFGETDKDIKKFMSKSDIKYPYHKINIDDFFDLIGSVPPRLYWLKDGEVVQVWDERIEEKLWDKFGQRDNLHFELNVE